MAALQENIPVLDARYHIAAESTAALQGHPMRAAQNITVAVTREANPAGEE